MKKEIIWRGPEFKYYHKEPSWYWINGLVAGLLLLFSLYQNNILLAIFIGLTELTIIILAKRLPKTIEFKITEEGIHFGRYTLHTYDELKGFQINPESDELSELILVTNSKINPTIKMNVFVKDQEDIREMLKNFINEVEYEATLFDAIADLLGL